MISLDQSQGGAGEWPIRTNPSIQQLRSRSGIEWLVRRQDPRSGHRQMLKVFCAPTRYTQGPQATEQLGTEIRSLGLDGPAIMVAGRNAIRLLSETWRRTFAEAGMKHQIFPFAGECTAA